MRPYGFSAGNRCIAGYSGRILPTVNHTHPQAVDSAATRRRYLLARLVRIAADSCRERGHEMGNRPPLVAEIEVVLRRYLQCHPQAIDTERGICEWWLRDARKSYPVADVRAAIACLVAAGELAKVVLPDGQYSYASPAAPRSPNLDAS